MDHGRQIASMILNCTELVLVVFGFVKRLIPFTQGFFKHSPHSDLRPLPSVLPLNRKYRSRFHLFKFAIKRRRILFLIS